ncbi:hypothetical protein PV396_44335 [Streptomyces sp. ME02-8801-2C]|uniref:hypothetical protein n=1 Tax=Streptomyces sp. ME02-8801-2C TaxID=3028680 RepID=UPI0029AFA79B|nr:hypothetical protein [Streptomyces sp. ME02-8801-2C]MDX3458875.1 hypothetical protein [Streptomyces sp. ME02-8801-2C]
MTSIDRTPLGTEPPVRHYAWLPVLTTLATLATVLGLALTGHTEAAVAAGLAGSTIGTVQITVHIRR